jgi:hypothetical protein
LEKVKNLKGNWELQVGERQGLSFNYEARFGLTSDQNLMEI